MSSMTYKDKKRKAGQLVIRMVTACHRKYVEVWNEKAVENNEAQ